LEVILTSPTQSSTQVWGDGDTTNGIAPTVRQPNPDDTLQAGDIIALQNTVELPRDPAQFFFDGGERGDKITGVGGAIAVSMAVWPESVSSLYAGAWALGSTSLWGTEYVVPVGEDIAGTGPNQRPGFQVVGINVQAVLDNTVVALDLDGDGSTDETVTLNQGEQYTTETGGVEVGARVDVQSGGPVQVHILTADPDAAIPYEARAVTLLPLNLLADEYLAPRSSDGDHWLHNPHSDPITVTATTATDVTTLTIPPHSTVKFPTTGLSGPTGVHFVGTDSFDGMAALDPDSARDWGYGLAPVSFLTTQALVGWAPGNNRIPPSSWGGDPAGLTASRIYVTVLTTTTLNVIYDLSTGRSDTFSITPLEEVAIIDGDDYDMTGAVLYTTDGVPFAAVWGQDMMAPPAQPSIDVGTGIIPLASMAVQKTITLIDDVDGSGDISWGDTLRFEIFTINNTNQTLRDAVISDTLPSTVDYVRRSSTVRSNPIPDDSPPQTRFPFDEGGYIVGDLQPSEVVTATFDAIVRDGVEEICNTAGADSPSVPPPGDATACVPAVPPIVTPTPVPPTPTPTPEPSEPSDTPEPPPPPPTPTPVISVVTPEPTLPVLYLPETGSGEIQAGLGAGEIFLLLVAWLVILGLGASLIQKQTK